MPKYRIRKGFGCVIFALLTTGTGIRILSCSSMDSLSNFNLYKDLESVLEYLNKHDNLQPVQQLLQEYNQAKLKSEEQKQGAKHPLIVLEGLDGSGKTSMTKKLAKKVSAERWVTPPESIRFLRDYFDSNDTLRTAYYSLGNYIAALEISCILHEKPVILDRFWHSTTAYVLAECVRKRSEELKLPDPSDDIYRWPTDLLKPDIVIFLSVSEKERLERHSRRRADLVTTQEIRLKDDKKFREDIVQAYTNMREPTLTIVDGDGSFEQTFYKLLTIIRPLLKQKAI